MWEVVKFEWPFPIRHTVESARVVLKSHHMQPEPVEIRAFVNQPDANAATRTIGNPAFAGSTTFFGHGSPDPHGTHPAEHGGHGDMPRPAPQSGVKERFDLELNITSALKAQKADAAEVSLKLVALDRNGDVVLADRLILEGIDLEFE